MSEIPAVYWMIIIGVVTFMFCFVLYYVAMLIRESRDAIRDSREMLKSADEILKKTTLIVNDVQETIATVKGTVGQINEAILLPIKRIGSTITTVGDFISGFKKDR
jgi:predicted PurR-regulated permease PerM